MPAKPYQVGGRSDETAAAPSVLTAGARNRILIYLSMLTLLIGFGSPYGALIEIPITFFLKNKLHLTANAVATFRLVGAAPLYAAFLFGFIRDRWSPLGLGDRGFLVLFGCAGAAAYFAFALLPASYAMLLAAIVVSACAYLFVSSAQLGLTSTLGQQHVMSGQMSAIWNTFLAVPALAAPLVGGLLSQQLEGRTADQAARTLFFVGAAVMAAIALFGLWRPAAVFQSLRSERAPNESLRANLARLVGHAPIYPALLIWLLWNFAPGSQTALQFFLQNTLRATDAQWGLFGGILTASFIPAYLLFGWLCQRWPLGRLLLLGTLLGVPQAAPLLFLRSMDWAFLAAVAIGLTGGLATAAYTDLIIRSCPKGLQGTMLMLSTTAFHVVTRSGDVLGAYLYDRFGGFTICVVAITVVYALILPVLLLVPRRLTETADGQTPAVAFSAD